MPYICYRKKKFGASALKTISLANEIIADYKSQGFELTLRQLYYQFVSRDLIPNSQREYKNLGTIINDGRLAGLIDWNAIIDRTRNLVSPSTWNSPKEIVEACASQFRSDKWEDQTIRVEVWVEKDALVGVVEKACDRFDVPFFACRGYTSQSEMWSAAQRLAGYVDDGKDVLVIHLGDHDPSGIDMSRDIEERLHEFGCGAIEVKRIALNMDQVQQYNPPPNPAKLTDSRCRNYMEIHGDESWELDALEPKIIVEMIEDEISQVLDQDAWDDAEQFEFECKQRIRTAAKGL